MTKATERSRLLSNGQRKETMETTESFEILLDETTPSSQENVAQTNVVPDANRRRIRLAPVIFFAVIFAFQLARVFLYSWRTVTCTLAENNPYFRCKRSYRTGYEVSTAVLVVIDALFRGVFLGVIFLSRVTPAKKSLVLQKRFLVAVVLTPSLRRSLCDRFLLRKTGFHGNSHPVLLSPKQNLINDSGHVNRFEQL